jgi:hypothetical protein
MYGRGGQVGSVSLKAGWDFGILRYNGPRVGVKGERLWLG